jgi:hypothetical protein
VTFAGFLVSGALSDDSMSLYLIRTVASGAASGVILGTKFLRTHDLILLFDLRLGPHFVASYASQGYDGSILTNPYTGFCGKLNTYFLRNEIGPYRRRHLNQFFFALGTSLCSSYLAANWGYTDIPTEPSLISQGSYRELRVQCLLLLSFFTWKGVYLTVALQ